MEGLKEVVGHLLGTFPIPLMERAVMAATDLLPKYPALGELAAPFLDNCARTLLLQVRTDRQVKEFMKHADNHGEQDYRGIDDEGESSPEVNLSAPLPPGGAII